MSDTSEPEDPVWAETIPVEVPTGLPARHDAKVEQGIHEGWGITMLHGLVGSRRHHGERYSALRMRLWRPGDPRPDAPADGSGAEHALRATHVILDTETGARHAGELADQDD